MRSEHDRRGLIRAAARRFRRADRAWFDAATREIERTTDPEAAELLHEETRKRGLALLKAELLVVGRGGNPYGVGGALNTGHVNCLWLDLGQRKHRGPRFQCVYCGLKLYHPLPYPCRAPAARAKGAP